MFKWGGSVKRNAKCTGGPIDLKAAFAEFWGLMFLVVVGAGTAMVHGFDEVLIVAFSFGMLYLVLSFTLMHHSRAHLNPAVTASLLLGGKVGFLQALCNWLAQFVGACLGGLILWGIHPCSEDLTFNLGSNAIDDGFSSTHAFLGEFMFTTLICFVYWEAVISPYSKQLRLTACIAIGFAYFLSHLIMIRIDGASFNPARSLGSTVIAKGRNCENFKTGAMEDLWIMFIAPILGGCLAAVLQLVFGPILFQERLVRNTQAPPVNREESTGQFDE